MGGDSRRCKRELIPADVAISGVALACTKLDDDPFLIVLSGRRILDREDRESALGVAGEDLQQSLVPDVAPGLPDKLVTQLMRINEVVLIKVQRPTLLKPASQHSGQSGASVRRRGLSLEELRHVQNRAGENPCLALLAAEGHGAAGLAWQFTAGRGCPPHIRRH